LKLPQPQPPCGIDEATTEMEVECSSTVNDLGYSGAVLFVQLMNRRYENASTVLTSNKGEHPWQQLSHA